MPNRILREGILTSEKLAALSWPAEVFYRRLMSVVDDFGRYYATPMLLRAACYPLQLDKVSDQDVSKWLGETRKADLVRVFESGGKPYLEMQNFRQQVRAQASKFPQPPADAQQMHSNCVADAQQMPADAHLDVDVDVVEDGGRKRPVPLPKGFQISEAIRKWAAAEGIGNLDAHLAYFRDWAEGGGAKKLNWDATFRNAIRGNWAKVPSTKPISADPPWKGAK